MSFDGIVTRGVVNELHSKLVNGKIDKIHQHESDELLIQIRNSGTNYKLLISASSNNPRIYLTSGSKENPANAPLFTMVMRKQLSSGIIKDIEQIGNDRVIKFTIESKNDFGEENLRYLIVEIMGKHSNIILTGQDGVIIDSVKRIPFSVSRVRQVLPGLEYSLIESPDKFNPTEVNREQFLKILKDSSQALSIKKFTFMNFIGLSPTIGDELSFASGLDSDRSISSLNDNEVNALADAFEKLMSAVNSNSYEPSILYDGKKVVDFHVLKLESFPSEQTVCYDSPSEMLYSVYSQRDELDRTSQKSQSIKKSISNKYQKLSSKLSKLNRELDSARDREKYKIYADLLSANLYKVDDNAKSIEVENFYDPELKTVEIPLDIKYTPAINAQRYYKKYTKLKSAENILVGQIDETMHEMEYLDSVLTTIELSESVNEIDELKEELIEGGYFKRNKKQKQKQKAKKDPIYQKYSIDEFNILVGKNNLQNDHLTFKVAKKDDIWMHAKNIPGSHVIIETGGRDVPEGVLLAGAELAAYFSKSRGSGPVAIDYTERVNVKRHIARKPGLVNYENYNTINADSSGEIIERLKS